MTLPGECVNDTQTVCVECDTALNIQLCKDGGLLRRVLLRQCGPYSRESGYYRNREEAELALSKGLFGR